MEGEGKEEEEKYILELDLTPGNDLIVAQLAS